MPYLSSLNRRRRRNGRRHWRRSRYGLTLPHRLHGRLVLAFPNLQLLVKPSNVLVAYGLIRRCKLIDGLRIIENLLRLLGLLVLQQELALVVQLLAALL